MKVVIDKNLELGRYMVGIAVSNYTQEEIKKIKTHGAPVVSIAPERLFLNGRFVDSLTITNLDKKFIFEDEKKANDFIEAMKNRIKKAVEILKAKTDGFSGKDEIEL